MRKRSNEGQVTMVGVVIALALVGLLTALSFMAFGGSGGGGGGGNTFSNVGGAIPNAAGDVTAKANLLQADTNAQTVGFGNYGNVTVAALSRANPDLQFTTGPSTGLSTVSVATSAGLDGGSITLAVHSTSGTCWYRWQSSTDALYGAQTDQSECQAVPLASAPATGPVSSTSIGWGITGFPG